MLIADAIKKSFAGVAALNGAALQVRPGESVGLVGPNGSGKSTLLNVISGFEVPEDGQVTLNGHDITGKEPWTVSRQGLVRTFQIAQLPTQMSVFDLMLTGGRMPRGETVRHALLDWRAKRAEEQIAKDKAQSILERLGLSALAGHPGGKLSGGQQKLLSLGMALMGDPEVLLLDEPTAGVNPTLRGEIAEHLRTLQASGSTLLIVEHDMRFIADTCDRVYVLDRGRMIADCPPSELAEHPQVLEAYLGRSGSRSVATETDGGPSAPRTERA